MSRDIEWKNDSLWLEVEQKKLYPPEMITWMLGATEITGDEDFQGKYLLDNGCGTGRFANLAKSKGANVIGTDISDSMLGEASKYFQTARASSYELPFKDESFDYVSSLMVMQVLDNPERAIKESHRVLKPGGKFYFAIVHPRAPVWNGDGVCHQELANENFEERKWVFNLRDGRQFTKTYMNRPESFYEQQFDGLFDITKRLAPKFPKELQNGGRYAGTEYLFMELIKN